MRGSIEAGPVWILGYRGGELPGPLADAIAAGRLAGLILFRDNLGGSVEAARALRGEILRRAPRGRPFLLVADEEGGLISQTSRLSLPGGGAWPATPTPRALGRIDREDETAFVGELLGRRLRALGIGVSLAPCLDLDTEGRNPVIGSRSFGVDPWRVAAHGVAFARGLARAGAGACFKHYPGHGGTVRDSHRELPTMEPTERERHERPFRLALEAWRAKARDAEARDVRGVVPRNRPGAVERDTPGAAARDERGAAARTPWVMGAHVDWGNGIPASLDRRALARLARWNGAALRVTDALDMAAVSQRAALARQALRAGNDLLLVGRDWEGGLAAVEGLERTRGGGGRDAAWEGRTERTERTERAGWSDRAAAAVTAWDARRRIGGMVAEDLSRLASLHRQAVRVSVDPGTLPEGPWTWIVPEGLEPYSVLAGWKPPRLRRRPVAEVCWIAPGASEEAIGAVARRAARAGRPVLVCTLFRGWPSVAVRRAWQALLELPDLGAVAHLLDEGWPPARRARGAGPLAVVRTSGPSREALTGLAEVLDRPADAWRRGAEGWRFPVDI